MRFYLILTFLLFSLASGHTQPGAGLVAYYSFDNCDAIDESGNSSDGIIFGNPGCGCGVEGNALLLDGKADYVSLGGNIENYLRRNTFTLSLYFRTTDMFGTHDILSKKETCTNNRSFSIRYTPGSNTVSVDLYESPDLGAGFVERLDPSLCWIHLVILKKESEQSIFVNGEKIASQAVIGNLDLENGAILQIANSPCLGTTDRRFSGYIDEIRLYNRPLADHEIQSLYLQPDRITSADTTIYLGGSVPIFARPSCANSIRWTPATSVSNPNILQPVLTPTVSQRYTLEYDYGSCTASDSISITVIDPSQIECGDVPLPNAFTPNNDGKNDDFLISNPFTLEDLVSFEIFDRWGNKVFFTNSVHEGWDGNFKNDEANPGMYLYKIKYTCGGKELKKTGSLMLIR
jgi:gliding motility-associated-like protein